LLLLLLLLLLLRHYRMSLVTGSHPKKQSLPYFGPTWRTFIFPVT
jgi:hypothetical protein